MANGDGECFREIRSGHPEDVPTDRQVLWAIHADIHRLLEAVNLLSKGGERMVEAVRKLIKAIEGNVLIVAEDEDAERGRQPDS